MALNARKIFSLLGRIAREVAGTQRASRPTQGRPKAQRPAAATPKRGAKHPATTAPTFQGERYPGDYTGPIDFQYSPKPNGAPDPGEVVWGWVPYEEDHARGKDRPVLLIGRDGRWLLGLMLTSKDNTNGRHRNEDYLDIGSGAWDRQGRASEVKLDRVISLSPSAVRREGAVLERERFKLVVDHLGRRR